MLVWASIGVPFEGREIVFLFSNARERVIVTVIVDLYSIDRIGSVPGLEFIQTNVTLHSPTLDIRVCLVDLLTMQLYVLTRKLS